jgi:hypothetical protein
VALGLHADAMTEHGGSPDWGLACATAYSFRRFSAQIKVGVEGSSPRGIPGNGGHLMMACSRKDATLALANGGRELQGVVSTRSSPNRCGTASTSSRAVIVAKNSIERRRYARIPHEGLTIYRCFAPRSCVARI